MPRGLQSRQGSAKRMLAEPTLAVSDPLLGSAQVLEAFSVENAGGSSLAMMLREFASRMMMMFDIGAASGSNFADYWQTIVDVRGDGHAKELKPLSLLFRFVYQHALLAEQGSETSRIEKLNVTKNELQRAKLADQIQGSLSKMQNSIDEVLSRWQYASSVPAAVHEQTRHVLDATLRTLEDVREEHVRALNVPPALLSSVISKARHGVMAVNLNPGLSVADRPTVVTPRRHAATPRAPQSTTAGLPVLSSVKAVRAKEVEIELPVRPYVSPFQIRPQFDVAAFEAQAAKHVRVASEKPSSTAVADVKAQQSAQDATTDVLSVYERLQRARQPQSAE